MAKIHDNISTILGANCNEEDILAAFRLVHAIYTSHPMIEAQGNAVLVHGDFNLGSPGCDFVGIFRWRFYKGGKTSAAHFERIFLEEQFRERDLATAHLSGVVKLCDRFGVEYVHLDAIEDGVIVWPQLGFELIEPDQRKLVGENFRSIVDGLGYQVEVPGRTAAMALLPPIEGVQVGLRALALTYDSIGEAPIPMILDLHDKNTREFLADRGIL